MTAVLTPCARSNSRMVPSIFCTERVVQMPESLKTVSSPSRTTSTFGCDRFVWVLALELWGSSVNMLYFR